MAFVEESAPLLAPAASAAGMEDDGEKSSAKLEQMRTTPVWVSTLGKNWLLVVLVCAHFVVGTCFFHFYENWSLEASAYFCVVVLTTVGYGDITPSSDLSKLFTCLYICLSVGFVFSFLSLLVENLIDSNLGKLVQNVADHNSQDISDATATDRLTKAEQHHLVASTAFFVGLIFLSVIMFHFGDGMGFVDAIYFVIITASTVGLGDFHPRHAVMQTVSVFWIVFMTISLGKLVGDYTSAFAARSERKARKALLSKAFTRQGFKMMDLDQDNALRRFEFVVSMLLHLQKIERGDVDDLLRAFDQRDLDRDGLLTHEESELYNQKYRSQSNMSSGLQRD
ncbi:Two-pore potassium channel 1 [Porphyridium purpureum]|uniref:Two-pore potassium channel 1 n=1 Tax=Porphyridium purpureum TaxID=35688 RepID=A0A5J4YVB5_PORPP|nr:Two-pore potassium channel 1 [Porphyridium purpureum]|eukprot:POR9664..scf227_4